MRDLNIPSLDTSDVGVFVGTNVPEALQQLEIRSPHGGDGPVAVLTHFGWTVMGKVPAEIVKSKPAGVSCYGVREEEEVDDAVLKQFWLQETFGTKEEKRAYLTKQEEKALEILASTIRHIGERYEVGLPWKSCSVELPNNRSSALRRLYATEARFRVDVTFGKRYTSSIETYMTLGFARRLTLAELEGPRGRTWYLAHFLVESPSKPDKPRLVFDAASRHQGVSLNDALITVHYSSQTCTIF